MKEVAKCARRKRDCHPEQVLSKTLQFGNLQGPLLSVLMHCCSSSSLEVQQLALATLNSLATVPESLPAFSRVNCTDHLLQQLNPFCCYTVWRPGFCRCGSACVVLPFLCSAILRSAILYVAIVTFFCEHECCK